jgi:hypothetical protein
VEDQVKKLVERLFATEDLRGVQILAVELQHAVYRHIERLQKKSAESRYIQSDGSVSEIAQSSPSFAGQRLQEGDEES